MEELRLKGFVCFQFGCTIELGGLFAKVYAKWWSDNMINGNSRTWRGVACDLNC